MAYNDAAESQTLLALAQTSEQSPWHRELQETHGPSSRKAETAKHQPDTNFRHAHASAADVTFVQKHGAAQSAKDVEAIRTQISKQGTDPEQALVKAVQSNRVIGFGDVHGAIGAHTEFLQREMAKLKASGVTHLAIEYPKNEQTFIDQWDTTTQSIVRNSTKGKTSYTDIISAAKAAGIKVVAVDKYSDHGENDPTRDQAMAQNIGNILKDPHAKVAFYVGASHLASGNNESTNAPSTAQLLRDQHITVATFFPQVPTLDASLTPIAKDLKKPLSVATSEAKLVASAKQETGAAYGRWDNVLFFPPGYGMEKMTADLQRVGKDPKPELQTAVKDNRVLFMGEMERLTLDRSDSPHKRFLASEIPALKQAGLTDIAINMPPRYQPALDQYEKTGALDKGALPFDYSGDDFRSLMKAAKNAGIKLHAIGPAESTTPLRQDMHHLAASTLDFVKQHPNAKTMVLCDASLVANYTDGNLVQELAKKGVKSTAYATLSGNHMAPDTDAVTQVVKAPTLFKPEQSTRLKELKTPLGEPVSYFDNVIIYPSMPKN